MENEKEMKQNCEIKDKYLLKILKMNTENHKEAK